MLSEVVGCYAGLGRVAEGCFTDLELCRELDDGSTAVALRLGYYLPTNLRDWVGPVGVWGDVNALLEEDMRAMKARPSCP